LVIVVLGCENVVVVDYDQKLLLPLLIETKKIVDTYQCYKSYNLQSQNNIEFFFQTTTTLGCRNFNIGFTTKCGVQGPRCEAKRMCLAMKHTFTNGGKCKRWNPMTPKCTPTLTFTFMWEFQMFRALVGKANKHQIGPPGYHWKGLEV
jgi:hypothetical protein